MWRGDHNLPTHEQGITTLGTPLRHADFVQGQLWDQGVLPGALARSSHTTHVGNGKSVCVRRFVLEKRRAFAVNRALGQLGGHTPCDPRTSS